ncbi:cupin domain-containing protein [Treponema phagedenis]|nr:cupin domain-containing protein [Treponema phagedenis]
MKNIESGKVFELKNAIDCVDGGISNVDIVSKENLKMMLMAFDAGEGLTPHSAPGDALVVPLEGEAEVLVGEKTFKIKVGEHIVFPKNIIHNVTAVKKFKMLLILVID